MSRADRKYVLLLAAVVLAAVAVEVLAPEPLDWSQRYTRDDTVPYGSRVVFDVLDALFPEASVVPVDLPPYVVLRDTARRDVAYLFITDIFAPDPAEAERLLAFAARGNTLFVAAHAFDGRFADTLGLAVGSGMPVHPFDGDVAERADSVQFVNPALRPAEPFRFEAGTAARHFTAVDTVRTTVLGTGGGGRANFVRTTWGRGAIYLNTVPLAFTNYNMLAGGNAGYVAGALSYLSAPRILWDAYHKPGRVEASTPLRFVLSVPSLRWAYYLGVATLLLFIVFRAKRRQRVVPVVEPLRNTTIEFVETVGRLYYRHGDHGDLARKRIAFFLDHLRTHLRLPVQEPDDAYVEPVSERSGVPVDAVRRVFSVMQALQERKEVREEELLQLSDAIERYHALSRNVR